jgi:hypothetical protein
MVVDGEEGKRYGDVSLPIFSADSRRVAYAAQAAILSGDVASAPTIVQPAAYTHEGSGVWGAALPRSPQGAPKAQGEGQWRWVIDGQLTAAYDQLLTGPGFSPDGSRFAFAAARGEQQFVVLLDDSGEHAGKVYDSVVMGEDGTVRFDDDDAFHYLAVADNREGAEHGAFADVWLVEERILGGAVPGTVGIGDPYYPTLGKGGYGAQHYTV